VIGTSKMVTTPPVGWTATSKEYHETNVATTATVAPRAPSPRSRERVSVDMPLA